jgi:hypothetical protein
LGGIYTFIITVYRVYDYTWQQSVAVDEARRWMEIMIKEIREAKPGDDGSYPIVLAQDKEFIFYSDIDKDGQTERVRYFLGSMGSGNQIKECLTYLDGGSCSVSFSDFLTGSLVSASVKVSVEGDFGWSWEHAEIYADGVSLGRICQNGCSDCAATWQGTKTFDVTSQASDGSIQFIADANWQVDNICDWQEPNHAMKAKFEFSWVENISEGGAEFKRGIINPTASPVEYLLDQEKVQVLTSYVRNAHPIFRYFDEEGNELTDLPARLKNTKVMEVFLVLNVDPNRVPDDFELKSAVQLRNLKEE